MKIALLLGGYLFVAFGKHTVLGERSIWFKQLGDDLARMEQELKIDGERMEQEFKVDRERMEADGQKMRQEAEAERKRMYAELDRVKQKCASTGITKGNDAIISNGRSVGLVMQETNGILHFLEQTINPTTKQIKETYYSLNTNDPNAKPVCGMPIR